MESIDFIEFSESEDPIKQFIAWIILESSVIKDAIETIKKQEVDGHNILVEMKINGVEVPFIETCTSIYHQLDTLVKNKTYNTIEGLYYDIQDRMQDNISEALIQFRKDIDELTLDKK